MNIVELISRLEEATAPDRWLDVDIHVALGFAPNAETYGPYLRRKVLLPAARYYTMSLEEAWDLATQVFPGWTVSVQQAVKWMRHGIDAPLFMATVFPDDIKQSLHEKLLTDGDVVEMHRCAPIALVLAVLRAKHREAQDGNR
ncbi:hypothetical protein G6M86_07230 [Agrobacterium tumefaciens]|uniref:Uncharacterized protein n=1 Tax=Agrobacterium tumefaciens TaxID=358 RepID=A0AAJ4N157_AGRTU|nr:hypothetical protein G6M86_07230 [Agrobacterium tumefaciens]